MTNFPIGRHGWSGNCRPEIVGTNINRTFSVGCFKYFPAKNEKGYKKGPVIVRIYGLTQNPGPVYKMAVKVCDQLDAGTYNGNKNIYIGGVK